VSKTCVPEEGSQEKGDASGGMGAKGNVLSWHMPPPRRPKQREDRVWGMREAGGLGWINKW